MIFLGQSSTAVERMVGHYSGCQRKAKRKHHYTIVAHCVGVTNQMEPCSQEQGQGYVMGARKPHPYLMDAACSGYTWPMGHARLGRSELDWACAFGDEARHAIEMKRACRTGPLGLRRSPGIAR
jgi:hypothetical protein